MKMVLKKTMDEAMAFVNEAVKFFNEHEKETTIEHFTESGEVDFVVIANRKYGGVHVLFTYMAMEVLVTGLNPVLEALEEK